MIDTYVLPGEDLFPEGITEGLDGATFYVGSSSKGTIFRGHIGAEQLEIWQEAGADGRESVLGLTVDLRGRLLACGNESGYIFVYDTNSGALDARHQVPAPKSLLNDICVAGGYAYVTDSSRPVLWRLELGETVGEPEEWLDLGDIDGTAYLNGIVSLHDGGTLLVAAQGGECLWRIDIASRKAERVGPQIAADGMVLAGDLLYACDNVGTSHEDVEYFVSMLRVSPDAREITLEHRTPWSRDDTPTTCAWLAGRLFVVNAQFGAKRRGIAKAPFTITALSA